MSQSFDIAVIGATGTVGETIVQILEERDFPVAQLHLLASIESAGHSVPFRGKNVRVREVDEFDFSKAQVAFCRRSGHYPQLCSAGHRCGLLGDRFVWRPHSGAGARRDP